MLGRLAPILVPLLATVCVACQPAVGDACEVQTDCGRTMYCERSLPGGYCTARNCHVRPCPEDSTCVVFDPDTSFCMALCDSDGDCRSSYMCVTDYGSVPFCNDARGDSPTPDSATPGGLMPDATDADVTSDVSSSPDTSGDAP